MRFELSPKAGLGFVLFIVTGVWLFAMATLVGIPEIFGLGFGWNLRFMDSGRHVIIALTPKIASRQSSAFLVEGEELVVEYDYQPEQGSASVALSSYEWLPFGDEDPPDELEALTDIRSETRGELRVIAREPRFFVAGSHIDEAEGEFAVDWRVENAAIKGRLARLFILVTHRPVFHVLLIAAAMAVVLIRQGWKKWAKRAGMDSSSATGR